VPNQPRTPIIGFRCPPELREQLERIALDRGETLTDLIRRVLREYVANWPGRSSDS
jgi:hypothetical protein